MLLGRTARPGPDCAAWAGLPGLGRAEARRVAAGSALGDHYLSGLDHDGYLVAFLQVQPLA